MPSASRRAWFVCRGWPASLRGFLFGFAQGSVQCAFGLTPTKISILQPGGTVVISGTFDNSTAFHDYVFGWTTPGSTPSRATTWGRLHVLYR